MVILRYLRQTYLLTYAFKLKYMDIPPPTQALSTEASFGKKGIDIKIDRISSFVARFNSENDMIKNQDSRYCPKKNIVLFWSLSISNLESYLNSNYSIFYFAERCHIGVLRRKSLQL